ncbi:hypothetical protein RJ640_007087 [Escallonia rubra]|uniref:C3H1-type domain-containing protein n=1 Tax=Escallonia rubra TaxID=112253 RepID=A0AA88R7V0_9ASTE|nr:hypothetical protein RJ640_007087 [Escallonia rubra]
MVGGTSQQVEQHQVQKQLTQHPITPEEEALKRNTDCVYFLASPLTCKKGTECEYRHSDFARVNPRDCWYWLNGNCLNPKCAFRHPPLDGLLGTEVSTPVAPLPLSQAAPAPTVNASYASGKQGVPCIFFQKGLCLKGDRCPFSHGPNSGNSKVVQSAAAVAAAPAAEPPTLKKALGGLQKCTQDQNVPQIIAPRSVELRPQGKPVAQAKSAPVRNGVAMDKNAPSPPPSGLDELRHRPTNASPVTNGNLINRSNRVHQTYVSDDHSSQNGKDPDEFSRDPSPGFDVLVDDDLRDSDYYDNEDQHGRTRSHEGRDLNHVNDYDIGRSADYSLMADVDRDIYRDPRGYDSYEHLQGQYPWEERRASSERMLGGSAHLERRRHLIAESPDQSDQLDLRYHLVKQRRGNGLRSVISRDHARENHDEDRNYRAPQREARYLPPQESSLSRRLRGRIKLPGQSTSPVNENNLRGRHRGRLSPERPLILPHQGRLGERVNSMVQEDFDNDGRNSIGPRVRRDDKNADGYEQRKSDRQLLGKRKYPKLEDHRQSDGDLSFEGPKPLSEILKRKRGVDTSVSESGMTSGNNEDQEERKERFIKHRQGILSSVSKADVNPHSQMVESADGRSTLQRDVSELEFEDGMIGEAYDQREGESDYEQVDGEDYNLDEGENLDPEEEYLDDDDTDDFAKKMGVMYS